MLVIEDMSGIEGLICCKLDGGEGERMLCRLLVQSNLANLDGPGTAATMQKAELLREGESCRCWICLGSVI